MTARYADPVDQARHGDYRIHREPGDARPLYRFGTEPTGRGTVPAIGLEGRNR